MCITLNGWPDSYCLSVDNICIILNGWWNVQLVNYMMMAVIEQLSFVILGWSSGFFFDGTQSYISDIIIDWWQVGWVELYLYHADGQLFIHNWLYYKSAITNLVNCSVYTINTHIPRDTTNDCISLIWAYDTLYIYAGIYL